MTRWLRRRDPWRFRRLAMTCPELTAIRDAQEVAELIARNQGELRSAGEYGKFAVPGNPAEPDNVLISESGGGAMYPIQPDETVLWTGRPERYYWRYRDYHWFVVVVVVIVTGVVLTSMVEAPAYGVPVLAVSVSGIVGPAIARHRERASRVGATTYLVTDQRLVFARYWPQGAEFRWIPLVYLRRPRVRDIGGGLGIVDFRRTVSQWLKDQGYRPRPVWYPKLPELMGIRDAHEVAELISRNAGHSSLLG